MTSDDVNSDDRDPRRIVAVGLSTLFPDAEVMEPTPAEGLRMAVAQDWQAEGAHAQFAEIPGMTTGQPPGRMTELFARIASSGEQLMLAGTCLRDARRWDSKPEPDLARGVASRGLAEMANYFALSAAHGIANVSLRLLLLDAGARAELERRFPRGGGFVPFTEEPQAWVAFKVQTATALETTAAPLPQVVRDLISQVVQLAQDDRWAVLMNRRAIDFHRLRPQSVQGGVALGNPWTPSSHGQRSMEIGEFSGHQPPDAATLVAESNNAVDALTHSAEQWMRLFPDAINALLGTPFLSRDDASGAPKADG
jgi:hypothetical protein